MITLFIFKSSSRGMQYGIGTYINELTCSLQRNHDLMICLVSYNNSSVKEFTVNEISGRFIRIDIPSPALKTSQVKDSDRKYAAAVVKLLSSFIPDSDVIFQLNYIDDLQIGRLLKEKYNHPIISVVHFAQYQQLFNANKNKLDGLNIDNPSDNIEFTLFTEKELYRISDHIVSVTGYMKDFLVHYYKTDPEKISVISNGLEILEFERVSDDEKSRIRRELGFKKDDIICLFSGRIDQCKGVGFLLPAFEEACRKADNLKLVLLGQGSLHEFQSEVKSAYAKIIYTGFLPKDRLKMFYQVADMGIIPSVYDHCPYTALEMIAAGIPLIMSRIDGLKEILDDSECLFIDPVPDDNGDITLNKDYLSELFLILARDEKLRKRYSEKAFSKLMNRNTSRKMAESMYSIFQDLIKINERKSFVQV